VTVRSRALETEGVPWDKELGLERLEPMLHISKNSLSLKRQYGQSKASFDQEQATAKFRFAGQEHPLNYDGNVDRVVLDTLDKRLAVVDSLQGLSPLAASVEENSSALESNRKIKTKVEGHTWTGSKVDGKVVFRSPSGRQKAILDDGKVSLFTLGQGITHEISGKVYTKESAPAKLFHIEESVSGHELTPLEASNKELSQAQIEDLWNGFAAADKAHGMVLSKALSQGNQATLGHLVASLNDAGIIFYGGVSAEKCEPKNSTEVTSKLLAGPARLKSKLWASEADGGKVKIDHVGDLKLLAELTNVTPQSPGMKGFVNLSETEGLTFERVVDPGSWGHAWGQVDRLETLKALNTGEEIRVWGKSKVPHLRLRSLESAGAADFFYNNGDQSTLSRPEQGKLIQKRLGQGFEIDVFSPFGNTELNAYDALSDGAQSLSVKIGEAELGTLETADEAGLAFYKEHLSEFLGSALDLLWNKAEDRLEPSQRAVAFKALYTGAENYRVKHSPNSIGYSDASAFAEDAYKEVVKLSVDMAIPTAQRWGNLADHFGHQSNASREYVLETLPALDVESAKAHFARTMAAVEEQLPLERAIGLSDIGELDSKKLALKTISGLASAAARFEEYDREQADYLTLLKHQPKGFGKEESRDHFMKLLDRCGKAGDPNKAGALYRTL
jgi:hypothetical protein